MTSLNDYEWLKKKEREDLFIKTILLTNHDLKTRQPYFPRYRHPTQFLEVSKKLYHEEKPIEIPFSKSVLQSKLSSSSFSRRLFNKVSSTDSCISLDLIRSERDPVRGVSRALERQ